MQVVSQEPAGPGAREPRGGLDIRAIRPRRPYLDNLKLILVAVIIAGHGALAYGDLESAWPYQDIQEVQLAAISDGVLSAGVVPAVLFTMGLFFLISGLVTPGSLSRRGPRVFARRRLLRLGVPLVVWTLLVWPAAIWVSRLAAGDAHSLWWQVTNAEPILDTGPLWFVEVLLVYSLAYAGWRAWPRRRSALEAAGPRPGDSFLLPGSRLALLAAGISGATMLVRLVFPIASGQIGQSHLWQWPQFVAMFGLGIFAAERGWLDPVPDRIRRGCGFAALGGVAAFGALAAVMAVAGLGWDVLLDEPRLHWAPLTLAAIEGPLAVGASIWLLGTAQRRLDRRPGPFGHALARSAYAAFLVQGVVLIGLMIAMRPIGIPAEIKALTVATLGVAGSFAFAWVLVSHTRLGRVM